jgi:hypothetical protein
MRAALLAPQLAHHLDVLPGARAAPLEWDAERLKLLGQPAHPGPENEATARQKVDGRHRLREHQRVVLGD